MADDPTAIMFTPEFEAMMARLGIDDAYPEPYENVRAMIRLLDRIEALEQRVAQLGRRDG